MSLGQEKKRALAAGGRGETDEENKMGWLPHSVHSACALSRLWRRWQRSPPHSGNCPAPGTPSFAVGCPGSDPGRHHHGVLAGGSSIAGLFADDHTWIWAVSKYLSTRGLPTRLLPTVHRLMPSVLPLFETTLESTPTDLASDFTRRTGATYSVLSSGFMNACCPS